LKGGAQSSTDEYTHALIKTTLVVLAAIAFGLALIPIRGKQASLEFFSGYIVEQSLSIDNIFVFILLFDYFRVPLDLQRLVLSWGIWGAVWMRGVMILLGSKMLEKARSVLLVFAGVLIVSGFKLLSEGEGEAEDLDNNAIMKIANWIIPSSPRYDGNKFFTFKNNKRLATPLLTCLICIELSDFVFAIDSIPAVLGITKDPVIVYASNIFAILALRSLYTVVAKAVEDLVYLRPAVAMVLTFVGCKMAGEFFHYEVSTETSLAVVVGLLGAGVGGSVLKKTWKKR